uniref:Uncharacterized protein n=1 Tax=Aegilops tauschii subsp. strangulata TaxID=200361 RepID=A0A453GQM7_AEGTS
MVHSPRRKIPSIMLQRGKAAASPSFLILQNSVAYTIWRVCRGKWAESNAESGQEEALTGKKEFFIKGAGKPHFQGGRGRGRGRGRGQQHGRGSGDRVSFRSRSEAQSGDGQSSRGGRPQGRGTRPGNGGFNRTRGGGGGMGPSSHSPRFKKPRTAAAS